MAAFLESSIYILFSSLDYRLIFSSKHEHKITSIITTRKENELIHTTFIYVNIIIINRIFVCRAFRLTVIRKSSIISNVFFLFVYIILLQYIYVVLGLSFPSLVFFIFFCCNKIETKFVVVLQNYARRLHFIVLRSQFK